MRAERDLKKVLRTTGARQTEPDSSNNNGTTNDFNVYSYLTTDMCKRTKNKILNKPGKGGSISSTVINDESTNLFNIHQKHVSYLAIFIIVAMVAYMIYRKCIKARAAAQGSPSTPPPGAGRRRWTV